MNVMKKIVIIPNLNKEGALEALCEVSRIISRNGAEAFVEEKYIEYCGGFAIGYKKFIPDSDLIIVIGGDGSVIDASVIAVEYILQ